MSEVGEMEQIPTITNNPPVTGFLTFLRTPQSTVRNMNRQEWWCSKAGGECRRTMSSCVPWAKSTMKAFLWSQCLLTIKQCLGQHAYLTDSSSSQVAHWPRFTQHLLLSCCPHPLSQCSTQCLETSQTHTPSTHPQGLWADWDMRKLCLSMPPRLPTASHCLFPSAWTAWSTEFLTDYLRQRNQSFLVHNF